MHRLYADEDFPLPVVAALRDLGHDVVTAQEAGRGNQGVGDADVLADATALGRAVLTHNRLHYRRLHKYRQPHGGVISCTRDDDDFPALAQRIHDAIVPLPDLANQFLRIVRPNPPAKP
jgi:hypothetical protein